VKRALALVVLAACSQRDAAAPPDPDLDGAKAQVRRFFDAVAHADCATMGALVAETQDPAKCAKLVHEWQDDLHVRLIDIADARRDGRDARAIIVRASVMRREAQKDMLVRVTREGGAWRLGL